MRCIHGLGEFQSCCTLGLPCSPCHGTHCQHMCRVRVRLWLAACMEIKLPLRSLAYSLFYASVTSHVMAPTGHARMVAAIMSSCVHLPCNAVYPARLRRPSNVWHVDQSRASGLAGRYTALCHCIVHCALCTPWKHPHLAVPVQRRRCISSDLQLMDASLLGCMVKHGMTISQAHRPAQGAPQHSFLMHTPW
jgi:hypothetical protein